MALVFGLPKLNTIVRKCQLTFLQPSRQLKSDLKIKWVRPDKVPCIKPEMSGDLEPLGTLDMTQFPSTYKASEELQSADDIVKRIHTLEFCNRKTHKEEFLLQYTNRVKSHRLDDDSPEVKIAQMTVTIRNLQEHLEKCPRDKVNKVRLKETIDKRNRRLTLLRHSDYKKFEWLLEKLNIKYKVFGFMGCERVERKRSLRRLTMLFVEKLKSERLAEYKNFLESQKEGFLKEKLEKLVWMQKTEELCGVNPTVTNEDIETVRKQLSDLQIVKTKAITE